MSEALITKRALASSLKKLMERRSLSKLTVGDIVEECSVTRKTFYNHFRDKYELLNWIYQTESAKSISGFDLFDQWTTCLDRLFANFYENRAFYVHALNDSDSTSFERCLFEVTHKLVLSNVLGHIDELAAHPVSAEQCAFIADFYAFAFVGIATRWIREGMKEPPATLTANMCHIVDGTIGYALENWAPSGSSLPARLAGEGRARQ